jgi:hypothetical protein
LDKSPQNGKYMSDTEKLFLHMHLSIGDKASHLLIDPEQLYYMLAAGICETLKGGSGAAEKISGNKEQQRMAQLVQTSVKGALLMFGDKILDAIFHGKNHPKPEKGDDLIEWYALMFAKIGVASATKSVLHLTAEGGEYGQPEPITITQVCTVSLSESPGTSGTSEAEGAGAIPPALPCADCGHG